MRTAALRRSTMPFLCAVLTLAASSEVHALDVEQALRDTATHINRSSPRPIGRDAKLDGATAYERTLKYRFSFGKLDKDQISSAFAERQSEFLHEFVCATPEMQVFVENGVTLTYAYYDRRGKEVAVVTVDTRHDCSND